MQTIDIPSDLAAIPATRARFFDFLNSCAVDEPSTLRAWQHIFTESLSNAIVHGNKSDATKPVCIGWARTHASIELHVADTGTGPQPREAKLPGPTAENGRGLYIIHALCDTCKHTYPPSGGYRQILKLQIPPTNPFLN